MSRWVYSTSVHFRTCVCFRKGGDYVEDTLLSLSQVAERFNVTEAVVRRLEKRGDLVPAKVERHGKQRRPFFSSVAVEELRQQREGESGANV